MPAEIRSVPQQAKLWTVAVATVRTWIAEGELKAFNVNSKGKRPKWRIHAADAEAFRENRSNVKKQPRKKPGVQPVREYV